MPVFSTHLSTRSCDGRAVVALRGELYLADAATVAAALTAAAVSEPQIHRGRFRQQVVPRPRAGA